MWNDPIIQEKNKKTQVQVCSQSYTKARSHIMGNLRVGRKSRKSCFDLPAAARYRLMKIASVLRDDQIDLPIL